MPGIRPIGGIGTTRRIAKRAGGGIPSYITNALRFLLFNPVADATYPNKTGDQDRVAAGGEVFTGRALSFDGVDQSAWVNDDEGNLDIVEADTDFCLSGWVKMEEAADSGVHTAFGKYKGVSVGHYGFRAYQHWMGMSFYTNSGVESFSTSIPDTDTDLHHYLLRIDKVNSKYYVYVDGVIENEGGTAFTGTFSLAGEGFEFIMGAANSADPDDPHGLYGENQISDVRIYHKDVTSADDLAALQRKEQLGDEVAWWWCEGEDLLEVHDASGNGYHLTAANFDSSCFVEHNGQSLMNKYGYYNDAGSYIPADMGTAVNGVPTHDILGNELTFKGQAQYPAIARDRAMAVFDGVDQYAKVADNGALDVGQASTDFCFSGGMRLTATPTADEYAFGKGIIGNTSYGLISNAINIYFFFRTTLDNITVTTGLDGTDRDWHHYIMRVDLSGSKVYIYLDGILVNTGGTAFTGIPTTPGNEFEFCLGAGNNPSGSGPDRHLSCEIHDVRIYHKDVTSAANLAKLQNMQAIGDEVAWWPCVEGVGSEIYDVAGSGYHLTGENFDASSWGNIDTPSSDYLAEKGLTKVEYGGDTRLVPYTSDGQSQYSSVAPILNVAETYEEISQNGKQVIPGTFFSLPEVYELIQADEGNKFFAAVTDEPNVIDWSDILDDEFAENFWYVNPDDRKEFMLVGGDETLTADEITALKKYLKIT